MWLLPPLPRHILAQMPGERATLETLRPPPTHTHTHTHTHSHTHTHTHTLTLGFVPRRSDSPAEVQDKDPSAAFLYS